MTRWSLVVEEKTDQSLRAFLGQKGAKKGSLSKFVEDAVREKLFFETAKSVKERNAAIDQSVIIETVDTAIVELRADRS